ncbi:hypothetical protein ACK8P5_25975 (plasmid) [Paenibacillus sp. EC2-1]|uniref:hypothetical protein n=1 Tax=Paenibacillus sp. EC2-1 TaxID=3388665 RepID=UPI003BEEFC9F
MFSPDVPKVSFKMAYFGAAEGYKLTGARISKEEFMAIRCDLVYLIADRTDEFPYMMCMFSPHLMDLKDGIRTIHFESLDPFLLREEIDVILSEYSDFESKAILFKIRNSINLSIIATKEVKVQYA